MEQILAPFHRINKAVPLALRTLTSCATFIGMRGEERVPVQAGSAYLTPIPHAMRSGMHHMRFVLAVAAEVAHHDIELTPGDLYFFAHAWSSEQLAAVRVERCVVRVRIRHSPALWAAMAVHSDRVLSCVHRCLL